MKNSLTFPDFSSIFYSTKNVESKASFKKSSNPTRREKI